MKKYVLLIILLLMIPITVNAETATNLSKKSTYRINNLRTNKLNDNSYKTYNTVNAATEIEISSKQDISHIYIIYELNSQKGILKTKYDTIILGTNGFLHEYQKLNTPVKNLSIKYTKSVKISEIRVYSTGDVPSDVQIWKRESKTDLMVFSTHADDEVLFFGGLIPLYLNQGKKVHVVYMCRHDIGKFKKTARLHEQLNGLWALGVTDYPTFGIIPDNYSKPSKKTPKEIEKTYNVAESQLIQAGFTNDDIVKFDVREIRKYQPKVIVGHDDNGEYGHGQHLVNNRTLKDAVRMAALPSYKVDNLPAYIVSKLYIHLYDKKNWTVLDLDKPLSKYNGKTAYEMTKLGFKEHQSQQKTWFLGWLNGKKNEFTKATQIKSYNPMYWGLYYSAVGPDINKNDLFENIISEESTSPISEEIGMTTFTTTTTTSEKRQNIINSIIRRNKERKDNNVMMSVAVGLFTLVIIFYIIFKKQEV